MKGRSKIAATSLDPEKLSAAHEAFDQAWAQIGRDVGADPDAIEAASTRLAEIVLRMVREGDADSVAEMIDVAVDVMRNGPQRAL